MRSKALLALAVAGALGMSGTAFAGSGTYHSAQDASISSTFSSSDSVDLQMTDTLASWSYDESFSTGASDSSSGSGSVAFSSTEAGSDPFAMEVYLVPAPLAANDGQFWVEKIEPTADALDRIATENVYVMTPIHDAIVDPQLILAQGPDAITLADLSTEDSTL